MHLGETSHCVAETDPSGNRGVSGSSSLVIHIRYPSRRFHPQHFYDRRVFIQWIQFKEQHEIQHKVSIKPLYDSKIRSQYAIT